MAVTIYVNGTPYTFPETNDTDWGEDVTTWAQSVSANTLQATGGNFPLTKDINFGVANGVIVQSVRTPQINAAANLTVSVGPGGQIDLVANTTRFVSNGDFYTLQALLGNTGASFNTANAAFSKANGAFDKANGAFDKANGAIYTAAQIRSNVSNTAPINYNATTGVISHNTSPLPAGSYGSAAFIPGFTTDAQGHVTAHTNFSPELTAEAIVDGIIPIQHGGTGFGLASVNGAILISNTAPGAFGSYNLTTITPGTGITILNGPGSITIEATGGAAFDQFARDTANGAFDKANTANVTGQAAFAKANGAIYTAAQIRANVSNTTPIRYDSSTGIFSHALSGVTATTYGNTTFVPSITVDSNGHTTAVSNTAIAFPVTSVAGRTGAVALNTNDVTENAAGPYYFTAARVRANVSNTAPIRYDSSTGIFSHAASNVTASGYGDAATVPKVVIDTFGHVSSVTNTAIAISATAVTSGTLAVARGGTGQTAITVNGSLLIGNTVSGGFDVNAITGGTGISITNNKGSITIAATTASQVTQGTVQNSTSGSNVAFTGIPAGCKRIMMVLSAVSLTGRGNLAIQLGNSGGLETTGYISFTQIPTLSFSNTADSRFLITKDSLVASTGATIYCGCIILNLIDATTFSWVLTGSIASNNGPMIAQSGGIKSLSAELDRVTLLGETAVTFDAGKVNIQYEV